MGLRKLLDDFTHVEDAAAWIRGQVDDTLASILPDDSVQPLRLDRTAIGVLLQGAFELPAHGDRPVTGAVTVCALEPMRSVPFRVIAVLGLDDGAFPRPGRTPAWDPFATPRPAEHDRRKIDRHLFLEAVLCARDALLLFGNGFEAARGARVPLSVVASGDRRGRRRRRRAQAGRPVGPSPAPALERAVVRRRAPAAVRRSMGRCRGGAESGASAGRPGGNTARRRVADGRRPGAHAHRDRARRGAHQTASRALEKQARPVAAGQSYLRLGPRAARAGAPRRVGRSRPGPASARRWRGLGHRRARDSPARRGRAAAPVRRPARAREVSLRRPRGTATGGEGRRCGERTAPALVHRGRPHPHDRRHRRSNPTGTACTSCG